MRNLTILKANLRRHKGSLSGIFIMVMIIAVSFAVVLTVWTNSRSYIYNEMRRLDYGDLTVWVSGLPETESLRREVESLPEVESAGEQQIVYANYEMLEQESDSEGQLITYTPKEYPYRFFSDDLSGYSPLPDAIEQGDIFVSASMVSMFGADIGDEIHFVAARNGVTYTFVIKVFFEDPFMGSSMIGMKSFLICEEDRERILQITREAGIDSLARGGAMIHVTQSTDSSLTAAELNSLLNGRTSLIRYTEFAHSEEVLAGFMLILQNIFAALLLAFVFILLITTFIVLGHTLSSAIEQDTVNMGIMKTVGYTSRQLRKIHIIQYFFPVVLGGLTGVLLSPIISRSVSHMTLTTTGVLIPSDLPIGLYIAGFLVILVLILLFVILRTAPVSRISPMMSILKEPMGYEGSVRSPIKQSGLHFWMALRQLLSGKKNYISSFLIAVLLVFFTSLIGRMNVWIGPNGEGLMDAFNPAELDLGVQIFSNLECEEVESVINNFSPITDYYELAMESVALNGVDYTANIITDPERLHILWGSTCSNKNEVVLTEFLAEDLGVGIGDRVTLSAEAGSSEYVISGFYQCANNMGYNLGLSREGYLTIAEDDPHIWCVHYFLEDSDMRIAVMEELEQLYNADIHVHENGWPGLYGIIGAMRSLMVFMYVIAAVVLFTAILLSGSKILNREQHDLAVYRVLGFSVDRLRFSFTLRFCNVATVGAIAGSALSAVLTDPIVDQVMRFAGISGFSSHPGPVAVLLPAAFVILMFSGFAFFVSRRMGRIELNTLIAE